MGLWANRDITCSAMIVLESDAGDGRMSLRPFFLLEN
jgi:hypothetical protein